MGKHKFSVEDLVRPNVLSLIPYSSARSEYTGHQGIFLDANENPFNSGFNRYPDPLQIELKKLVSAIKGVSLESVFVGNGSDEAIDLILRVFCDPRRDEILITEPTYGMYEVSAKINHVSINRCSLDANFQLSAKEVLDRTTPTTKVIFICSPNNPSGNTMDQKEIETILDEFHGIVVIDEAYIDFSGGKSWINQVNGYDKLIVLQTMSKAWGMASLRVGFAFSNPLITLLLNKIKPPYNVSGLIQKEAIKALENGMSEMHKNVAILIEERENLISQLRPLEYVIKVFPSDANFLLVKFLDADTVFQYLIENNIIVRNRSKIPLCDNCLRITIGTPKENELLIAALKNYNPS